MSILAFTIDDATRKQIDDLVRTTGKPEEAVLREALQTGLKGYPKTRPNAAKALLELAKWAEENNVTGPEDLSTNHDKYAYQLWAVLPLSSSRISGRLAGDWVMALRRSEPAPSSP